MTTKEALRLAIETVAFTAAEIAADEPEAREEADSLYEALPMLKGLEKALFNAGYGGYAEPILGAAAIYAEEARREYEEATNRAIAAFQRYMQG